MLVAHDLGTSGNKASLHDDTGRLVAAVSIGYPTRYAADTTSEQDPDDWWRAVVEATRALLAASGVQPSLVTGICVSGQMMGAVLLDRNGRPVRPAMIWSDQRATAQSAALETAVGAEQAYRSTGHRIAPTYTLPKLMWVRDNEPEAWAATTAVCVAKDFVNLRLTGRLVTDHSDASSTDAYDLAAGTWSRPLLDAAGIDAALWPEIVESTTVLGVLTGPAASELGLAQSTRVVAGGGDGPMASVGAGSTRPGDNGYVCLGTSAWFATTTPAPVLDPQRRSFTFRHVVPGVFTPCATTQTGAGSLQWVQRVLGGSIPDLVAAAMEVGAADDGLFFLPYLLGERSPWWDASASGAFLGLRPHHGNAHLARAVLEGVGYNLALCMAPLVTPGRPVDVIGGGAASDAWLQLLSDIWGLPVRRRSVTD
ncbi:MAG: FGGY family carbohydrate kinase, partial [Propionicimonas sp.]